MFFADLQGDSNPHLLALRPWYVDILNRFFPTIDQMLESQEFITGNNFTVADIALTCVLREIRKTEVLDPYPNIKKYPVKSVKRDLLLLK